jgi:hypothetical protein
MGAFRALAGGLLLVGMLAACGGPREEAAAAERAAAMLAPFKRELMSALQAGLEESPSTAVQICRVEAPRIAERAAREGIEVGRTSHRLRNPDNAPEPWMQEMLDAYLADAGERTPRTVALDDGRIGYVEPIVTQPLCTICHGPAVAADLLDEISRLYPADLAIGFNPGDLRGIFWVKLPGATR